MAIISVQPVDGLIYRLLQQNSKPSASVRAQASGMVAADSATISVQARDRDQQSMHSVASQLHAPFGSGDRSLEAHLLSLYKSNDLTGG